MDDLHSGDKILDQNINFWKKLDNKQYDSLFENNAIRRTKFEIFKMNAKVVAQITQSLNDR